MSVDHLLLESGFGLLLESGDALLLESSAAPATSFEEDLLAFLRTLGLVCYPQFVPQDHDPAAPALHFTRIWTDREKMLGGSTGMVEAHYQLTIQSRDYLDLVATSETLRLALDGRRYFTMNGTRLVFVALMKDQTTAYESSADRSDLDGTHQLPTEFWFHYRETIPTFS